MEKNKLNEHSVQFLFQEYADLYQNVMHIENKIFNHLSFFTTVFIGIVTAAVAFIQLIPNNQFLQFKEILGLLCPLFGLLYVVGRFEIHMTTELRVRKIVFVEGIISIREIFVTADESIAKALTLPSKLEKAPPYLRLGSQDWYQVLYLCFMNSVSSLVFWFTFPFLACNIVLVRIFNAPLILTDTVVIIGLVWGLIFSCWNFWIFSYQQILNICSSYDQKREIRMAQPIKYDLLQRNPPSKWWQRTISDWFLWYETRKKKDEK